MNPHTLKSLLEGENPPHLLHILPPEIFEARRIPGSMNICIYLVAFNDLVRESLPDQSACVVVYSLGSEGLEARTAAERLHSLGFADVHVLEGGLEAWASAGYPIEGTGSLRPPAPSGVYQVNTETSVLRWTGRNLFNHHEGTLRLAGGRVELHNGTLIAAVFDVDMRSIVCTDIPEESMRAALVRHLMHSDFFDADQFPLAHFETTAANPLENSTEGTPNLQIFGNFTLRGVTRPLDFPALVAFHPDGRSLTAQALLNVDRTEFGSLYGSGRFFRFLGQHIVNDHFHVHLKIHAAID